MHFIPKFFNDALTWATGGLWPVARVLWASFNAAWSTDEHSNHGVSSWGICFLSI